MKMFYVDPVTRLRLASLVVGLALGCVCGPVFQPVPAETETKKRPEGYDACITRCYHTGSVGAVTQPGYEPGDTPDASWCDRMCREAKTATATHRPSAVVSWVGDTAYLSTDGGSSWKVVGTTACGGYVDGDFVVTDHLAKTVVVDCEACITAEDHAGGRTLEHDVLELRQRVEALERRLGAVGPRWRR